MMNHIEQYTVNKNSVYNRNRNVQRKHEKYIAIYGGARVNTCFNTR